MPGREQAHHSCGRRSPAKTLLILTLLTFYPNIDTLRVGRCNTEIANDCYVLASVQRTAPSIFGKYQTFPITIALILRYKIGYPNNLGNCCEDQRQNLPCCGGGGHWNSPRRTGMERSNGPGRIGAGSHLLSHLRSNFLTGARLGGSRRRPSSATAWRPMDAPGTKYRIFRISCARLPSP